MSENICLNYTDMWFKLLDFQEIISFKSFGSKQLHKICIAMQYTILGPAFRFLGVL